MSARVTEPIDLDTIAVGDHVTSKWSPTGAIWIVTHVGPTERRHLNPQWYGGAFRMLELRAIVSKRVNARSTYDLVKVVDA